MSRRRPLTAQSLARAVRSHPQPRSRHRHRFLPAHDCSGQAPPSASDLLDRGRASVADSETIRCGGPVRPGERSLGRARNPCSGGYTDCREENIASRTVKTGKFELALMDTRTAELTRRAEDALRQFRHSIWVFRSARKRTRALKQELSNLVQRQVPDSKMGQTEPCPSRVQWP